MHQPIWEVYTRKSGFGLLSHPVSTDSQRLQFPRTHFLAPVFAGLQEQQDWYTFFSAQPRPTLKRLRRLRELDVEESHPLLFTLGWLYGTIDPNMREIMKRLTKVTQTHIKALIKSDFDHADPVIPNQLVDIRLALDLALQVLYNEPDESSLHDPY
ncbi:MAG: hypothetical protein K2X01_02435 [Cyanobacteria bacterium]|nr:hypothetical protein [Cyanobacteriota bacterium]